MKKITIIIPFYNHPKLFQECLSSIASNNYFDEVEVLLVDDCGDKECQTIANEFEKQHENVTIIKNEVNMGVAHSRQIGANYASTTWVSFIDGDDCITEDYITKLIDYSHDESVVAHVFNVFGMTENSKTIWPNPKFSHLEQHLLAQSVWSKLWKKDYFVNLKFERIKFGEDLITLCSTKNFTYKGHDDFLYKYRVNSQSVTNNITLNCINDLFKYFENEITELDLFSLYQLNKTLALLKKTFVDDDQIIKVIENFEIGYLKGRCTYNTTSDDFANTVNEYNFNSTCELKQLSTNSNWKYISFNEDIKIPSNFTLKCDIVFFNFVTENYTSRIDFIRNIYDIEFNKNSVIFTQNVLEDFKNSDYKIFEYFILDKMSTKQLKFAWAGFNIGKITTYPIECFDKLGLLNETIVGIQPFKNNIRFIHSNNNHTEIESSLMKKNNNFETIYVKDFHTSKGHDSKFIDYETFLKLNVKSPVKGELFTRDSEFLDLAQVKKMNFKKYLVSNEGIKKVGHYPILKKIKWKIIHILRRK